MTVLTMSGVASRRVFLSSHPVTPEESRSSILPRTVHNARNVLARTSQSIQEQHAAPAPPFLFLYVNNLSHPLHKLKPDDFVLYVPTRRYRTLVEEGDRGQSTTEEVEAVRRKALSHPHTVIAITFHPTAADGVDSPDHMPPSWQSAHFNIHTMDDKYTQLVEYLQRLVANGPSAAIVHQQPPVDTSALALTAASPPHSQHIAAQPDSSVLRLVAASPAKRLRVYISATSSDAELTSFHPQAVQLLTDALNAYTLFDCASHSADASRNEGEARRAHCILFIPTARWKLRGEQPTESDGGAVSEMAAISERARANERSVICVTFPTVQSPAANTPPGWSTDGYELTGSEQSLQRLVYRLIGVEKGVKVMRMTAAAVPAVNRG